MMPGSRLARWVVIAVVLMILVSFVLGAVRWGI